MDKILDIRGKKSDFENRHSINGSGRWRFMMDDSSLKKSEVAIDFSLLPRLSDNFQVFSKKELGKFILDLKEIHDNLDVFKVKKSLWKETYHIVNTRNNEIYFVFNEKYKDLASNICLKLNNAEL